MTAELDGKVVIIAGAGPGIGRACALRLGERGADLALVARRPGPLEALAGELREATGRRAIALPADLADVDACTRRVEDCVAALGRVDTVVCVATASAGAQPVIDADWQDWRSAFEVNVVGTLEICRSAARHMKRQGDGCIVQIASLGMHSHVAKQAAYTSTKRAMVSASLTMARELGRYGIRVNIVTPGFTTGENLDRLWEQIASSTGRDPADVAREAAQSAALKRHVDPEDIAEAVCYLASPRARNVTGVEIIVDAGQHIGG